MKNLFSLFFALIVSNYSYSQITAFENLPISNVYMLNGACHIGLEQAKTVSNGKLWYIQKSNNTSSLLFTIPKDPLKGIFPVLTGSLLPSGTKIYTSKSDIRFVNITEYTLVSKNLSFNKNGQINNK
jgi:hypothetical protein